MAKEKGLNEPRICQPGTPSDNIKVEAEFERLIPPLSPMELDDLHKSLDTEGCRDALIVWKDNDDTLVDGHNRIRYCREKKYPFKVVEKEFTDRDQVRDYIIATQLGRRNLSPAAESYLRGKRYLESKKQGARTDLTSGQSGQRSTAEELGKKLQVAPRTIRRDGKFAEAVDKIVENCGQESRNLLLSREIGLTRGGVMRLVKLRLEEQQEYINTLLDKGKRPRKPRKGSKRKEQITLPSQPKAFVQTLLKQLDKKQIAEISKALSEAIERQEQEATRKEASDPPKRRKGKA